MYRRIKEQKLEEEEDLVDQGGEENIHFSCLKKIIYPYLPHPL